MPTYTYKCSICKQTQDKLHSMNETPEYTCCDKKMYKVISDVSFTLKGGGWGRDLTEKKERAKRSEKLGRVTKDRLRSNDPDSYRSKIN